MTAELLKGKPIADRLKADAAKQVAALKEKGVQPRVIAIHNKDNSAARVYKRMQQNLCGKIGIEYEVREIGDRLAITRPVFPLLPLALRPQHSLEHRDNQPEHLLLGR